MFCVTFVFWNDPDKEYNMPKDGTVHELTSNVSVLEQFHSHCLVLVNVITLMSA